MILGGLISRIPVPSSDMKISLDVFLIHENNYCHQPVGIFRFPHLIWPAVADDSINSEGFSFLAGVEHLNGQNFTLAKTATPSKMFNQSHSELGTN